MADLKKKLVVPDLMLLLQVIFDKNADWFSSSDTRYRRIAECNDFKDLMDGYKAPVKDEEDRYDPFCQLSNRIIALLSPAGSVKDRLVICRNDRVKILGSAATRFPDCVGVPTAALGDPKRGSPENLANAGPVDLPFAWYEIWTFFEFKMTKNYLGKKVGAALKFKESGSVRNKSGQCS